MNLSFTAADLVAFGKKYRDGSAQVVLDRQSKVLIVYHADDKIFRVNGCVTPAEKVDSLLRSNRLWGGPSPY
mgnify:CR=1 FL=1